MIIIRLFGGLGNQLFQYAAARALAEHRGGELKVDVSRFENYKLRNFDLAKLPIDFALATPEKISRLKAISSVQRIKQRLFPYRYKHFYKEPFFHHDPSFFRLGNNVYLQGYFQSEKYFLPITDTIRREYDFTPVVPDHIKAEGARLKQVTSVSVHIRRGDYNNPEVQDVHGVLPTSYYEKAVDLIRKQCPNAVFYIFSDDPDMAVRELNISDAVVLSGKTSKTHFEDIYLMSCCRHNIIANSSFSWWAAWLNNQPNKIVIAPKNWFNKGPKDTQDLLPQTWVSI